MLKHAWARLAARQRLLRERGATAVEYALLAALIAAVIAAVVAVVGQKTNTMFDSVTNGF